MTREREQLLREMGLGPVWKLRAKPAAALPPEDLAVPPPVAVAVPVVTDGTPEQVLVRAVRGVPFSTGVMVILGQPIADAVYVKLTVSILRPLLPGMKFDVVTPAVVATLPQFQSVPTTLQLAKVKLAGALSRMLSERPWHP